jgi:hypothetical protein
MHEALKLVILHDARNNTYAVWDHNLPPETAEGMIQDLRSKLLHAFTVDQRTRHVREDAEACRVCRQDVARASGLTPRPRFQRRNPS